MQTYHLHINGIVQGVGFRPMVYLLAKEMGLNGSVNNGSDGVHIYFNASEEDAGLFYKKIIQQAPKQSTITKAEIHSTGDKTFTCFSILAEDDNNHKKLVLIPPDIALCAECRQELYDKTNRRYRYPFITCTQCGPRYSVIQKLPYERENTSMDSFEMCANCQEEYDDILNRRFYAQTNSCSDPECSIDFSIWERGNDPTFLQPAQVLLKINSFLKQGKILAVKGIGGYLLLCDANDAVTIQQLRTRKQRPSKPLAILYPGIEQAIKDFEVNEKELELLESSAAPIVLLYPKDAAAEALAIQAIAPGLKRLGVMLPYSPLLELIVNDFGKPLIATSGNISGSPIIYTGEDALEHLYEIADCIIDYDRPIIVPQDDSVVQVSTYSKQQIIMRRSRGFASSFLDYKPAKKETVISTGAFLKSSFTIAVDGNVFVSQFLGSGESYESQQMYKHTLQHWWDLYLLKPAVILTDKHPGYFSHQYAIELAAYYGAEIKFIQHHEAHFAAVLAENNLMHASEKILGVILDGTGLGSDGNIWGGEFFTFENNELQRAAHFDCFPAIAGDKLALEPRIAALCIWGNRSDPPSNLQEKFSPAEWNNYQALISTTTLFSSSVGRIFDAVASLLNICDKQTYEGEAALRLQVLAEDYVEQNGFVMDGSYFEEGCCSQQIPTATLIQAILNDIENSKPTNYIAAKFHYSLVTLIDAVAQNLQLKKICFSGGVFQNALLIDWIQKEYADTYELFFHKNLSPNDENISFGQLAYYDNDISSCNEVFSQQRSNIVHHE